jgi:hypothetical protein
MLSSVGSQTVTAMKWAKLSGQGNPDRAAFCVIGMADQFAEFDHASDRAWVRCGGA